MFSLKLPYVQIFTSIGWVLTMENYTFSKQTYSEQHVKIMIVFKKHVPNLTIGNGRWQNENNDIKICMMRIGLFTWEFLNLYK